MTEDRPVRKAQPEMTHLTYEEAAKFVAGGCQIRWIAGIGMNWLLFYREGKAHRGLATPEIIKRLWLEGILSMPGMYSEE